MHQSSIKTWLTRYPAAPEVPATEGANGQDEPLDLRPPQLPTVPSPMTPSKASQNALKGDALTGPLTKPSKPTLKQLPPNVTLEACTKDRLASFQRLTALLLPIPYSKAFYAETVHDPVIASLTRVVIWKDALSDSATKSTLDGASDSSSSRVVGAIRCRLVSTTPPTLYISTLGILAPFREHGLATHLLQAVVTTAVKEFGVKEVTAHVWEANEEALAWYKKRGFEVLRKEEGYYQRLKPRTAAWIITWKLGITDMLGFAES